MDVGGSHSDTRGADTAQSLPLTVLFAPAHVLIDETQGGSEYHWPYKLMERLAVDHGVRAIALTVQSHVEHDLPDVQFISVDPGGPLPASNVDRLRFHLRASAAARALLASGQRIDVVHHMLPFGFRATFNLLALNHRRTDPPIVIGPLQPPLSYIGGDEGHVALRDFSSAQHPIPAQSSARRARPALSSFVIQPVLSTLSRATLCRATALVAISEQAARLYRSFTGLGNLTTIPAGVDTALFTPRPHAGRFDHDAGTRPVEVIAVGYLMHRKAFDVLIRAVGKLAAASVPVRLRIVGEGPARASLETLVHQLGIEHMVTFVGRVPHNSLVHEYHKADVFCSMSRSESFGSVLLEAMACGLPVVATPTGFFGEVLRNHRAGTLVRFGDADGLAAAVAELVASRHLREALGRQARQLMVREFDWSVIARSYLSLYRQLASPTG